MASLSSRALYRDYARYGVIAQAASRRRARVTVCRYWGAAQRMRGDAGQLDSHSSRPGAK